MIKIIIVGVWVCVVTVASCYGAVMYFSAQHTEEEADTFTGIEYIKTEMTSVPVIRNGEVKGYVIFQVVFAVDSAKMKEMKLEPAPFMIDEAYRAFYADDSVSFTKLEKQELSEIAKQIVESANKRLKTELIKEVLIQQVNYVSKDEIRQNWTASKK